MLLNSMHKFVYSLCYFHYLLQSLRLFHRLREKRLFRSNGMPHLQ